MTPHEILWTIIPVIACIGVFFQLRYVYEIVFNGDGVPNVRTFPAARRRMVEILRQDIAGRSLTGRYTIVDVGSGNGHLSRYIARKLPEARVIGLDRSRTGQWRSRLWRRVYGLANLEYRRVDFLAHDLPEADALVMYLSNSMMPRLRDKLRRELKPGALVISNTFELGGDWQPIAVVKLKSPFQKALLVYRQG
jgi:SAM-dependent methyltransferase